MAELKLSGIVKNFGAVRVLHGIDLAVLPPAAANPRCCASWRGWNVALAAP